MQPADVEAIFPRSVQCARAATLDRWTSQASGRRRIIFIEFSLNGHEPYEISELPGKQL